MQGMKELWVLKSYEESQNFSEIATGEEYVSEKIKSLLTITFK